MTTTMQRSQKQHAYTREIIALGAGGLLAGLMSSGLQLIAGGHGAPLSVLSFGALLGVAASFTDHREGSSALRVVLGVVGAISMALLLSVHSLLALAVGGAFIGAAFSLNHGTSAMTRVMVVMAYSVALMAGGFTAETLLNVGFFKALNVPVLQDVLRAGIWAAFLMLPGGLKYLEWQGDELEAEFKAARVGLTAKHRDVLDSAAGTYARVRDELRREAQSDLRERAEQVAQEVCQGIIALTRRASELEDTVAKTNTQPLQTRASELERRIRSTRDVTLRRELMAALEEVVEQMRTRQRMEAACVRIEARQQRYLTALERLHVTLIQNDTLSAKDGSVSLSLDELGRLTEEVHWKNLSVDELCGPEDEQEELGHQDDAELDSLLSELHALSHGEEPAPRVRAKGRAQVEDEAPVKESVVLDHEAPLAASSDEPLPGADGSLEEAQAQQQEQTEDVEQSSR